MIKRRRLGRTEQNVTELSFGAMNLRRTGSFELAYKIMNYALDKGINLVDTARSYSGTCEGRLLESEAMVGEVIASRSDLKEPIVIVTKGHGYTLDALQTDLELSLKTLNITGRHDLFIGKNPVKLVYFLHGISTERWETIKTSGVLDRLNELKTQGIVNFVGFSSHYPFAKEIKEAAKTGVFDVAELPYNVFNRSLGEDGAVDLLKHLYGLDMGIVNMKAFDGNGMVSAFPVLKDFMNITYADMLNFCLSNPYITTVDAGARFVGELELDVETALSARLSGDDIKRLKAEADKVSPHTKTLCRECTHCNEKFECPQKINFMDVLSVYSRYSLANSFGKDTSPFFEQYSQLPHDGGDCVECGACLKWCEYKLNVPKLLKQADGLLKKV